MNEVQGLPPFMSVDEAFRLVQLMSKCIRYFPEIPLSFPSFFHLHPTALLSSRLRGPAHTRYSIADCTFIIVTCLNVLVAYPCGSNRDGFIYCCDLEKGRGLRRPA